MPNLYTLGPDAVTDVLQSHYGSLPANNDSTIGATPNNYTSTKFFNMLGYYTAGGNLFSNGIISTFSLVHTVFISYNGGVLAANGDIHFVPQSATRGQKISPSGTVSTYSLVYTATNAYAGGVLAPNGDIHFIPYSAAVGQKISAAGAVSTYSLVYTDCLLYTSPSPRDLSTSRMPSSA